MIVLKKFMKIFTCHVPHKKTNENDIVHTLQIKNTEQIYDFRTRRKKMAKKKRQSRIDELIHLSSIISKVRDNKKEAGN